jgi:intein-encoded DNA endonuclease-like protein
MSVKLEIPRNRLRFLYKKKRRSTIKLAGTYSCSSSTIRNRLIEYGIGIRDASDSHIKYLKKDFSGNLIEKAYLIGFRLGDLHVRRYERNGKIISVECASSHPAQIELIRNLFKKYGYVRISLPNKYGITRIQCALNPSFNFLLRKEDKIEPWVLRNKNLFFSFLAGYIDAEGDLGVHAINSAYLRVGSYDINILSQAYEKLFSMGLHPTLKLDRPRGSIVNLPKYCAQMDKVYKTKGDFWRLAVYRKKDLLKLLDYVTPYLRHARMKLASKKVKYNILLRNRRFGNLRMV